MSLVSPTSESAGLLTIHGSQWAKLACCPWGVTLSIYPYLRPEYVSFDLINPDNQVHEHVYNFLPPSMNSSRQVWSSFGDKNTD